MWRAGFQPRSLGFKVYREVNGKKILISHELIAGSALLGGPRLSLRADRSYSWWDSPSQPGTRYWIEEVDLNGTSAFYGPATVSQPATAQTSNSASTKANSPLVRSLMSSIRLRPLKTRPTLVVQPAGAPAPPSRAANLRAVRAVKLAISQSGWYRVPFSALSAYGLSPGNGNKLHLYAEGREQALELVNNGVEFYATGLDTPSTDTRVYWVMNGALNQNHIMTSSATGGPSAGSDFTDTVERQDRTNYFAAATPADGIPFFGDPVESAPTDEAITAADLSRPDGAILEVALQGVTAGAHNVTVALNGQSLGTISSFSDTGTAVIQFDASTSIANGANDVTLTATADTDVSLVDHVSLTYQRTYTADAATDALEFTAAGGTQVTVNGFTNALVRMVDITSASAPVELTVTPAGSGTFAATVPGAGSHTIYAFGADAIAAPNSITLHKPSSLVPLPGKVDTVLITTSQLMPAVTPLVRFRQRQGLHIETFDIQDVYDQFNFGEKDPQAIKNFLAATQTGNHPPHYVLLVGDATFDPRGFQNNDLRSDLVPTKLINTNYFQAGSDGWFADFNNTGETTMAIGRLPGEVPTDVSAVVAKIIAYDKQSMTNNFLLTSDDEQGFTDDSNSLISLLPSGASQTSIERTPNNSNRQQLLDAINAGPDVVDYIGHGNLDLWASNWLTSDDVTNLGNTSHPAFFALMTCLNGYFIDARDVSLAEALLRANGGAVAVWSSSGVTVPSGQVQADQTLYSLLFGPNPPPLLGEAVRQAKNSSDDPDVRQTWNLLGDPETKLR